MLKFEDAKEYSKSAAVRAFYASKALEHTYTQRERNKAQTLSDVLDSAYKGTIYVNYRNTFIAVKLAKGALLRDKYIAQQITVLCAESNYKVVETKQGTIYRIPRQ